MTESKRPSGDEPFAWESDVSKGKSPPKPTTGGDAETYPIPGGMGGWSPADLPAGSPPVVVQKTPARDEPKLRGPRVGGKRKPPGEWAALAGFNFLVFASSVCVMTLELAASRLIAKHVGSSLYTWTSVIGVVLAGITLGNYLGGWLADRYNRPRTLSWMYLLASVSCASVLWLDQTVAGFSRPESLSWPMWVLCVVAMVFLLPALALGTTSPLVASMAIERSTRTGQTVGNVYAWGAFGSIVGTFLTGFYLIDVWGTRAIVGLTAGVLALLAVSVSGSRWMFRAAVVCGWLQLLTWCLLAATFTKATGEAIGGELGGWMGMFQSDVKSQMARYEWRSYGGKLALKLHEIGLLLELRDDQPGFYHDESSYSYIHVGDDYTEGSQVRYLRLDKLIHSYYEPDNPTALHYEYEEVYAAVTKQTAPGPSGPVTAVVPEFPDETLILQQLPAGVTFDAATRKLRVEQLTAQLADQLRDLSGDAPYWTALERLHKETNKGNWGGFSTVPLDELPKGVTIPADLFQTVRYDEALDVFTAYSVLTGELRDRLENLSPQAPWRKAVQSLRKQAGPLSALFLGGGGYIFPRWVAAEFPGATRLDVAELDPAVYRVVQQELGLTAADEQRIHTTIGDARNFVEDRLQENKRLKAAGKPPVLYDFIYGDAFNDFSVPFHLATVEFKRKLHELMTPNGVLQANIIDIYPRTDVPGGQVATATLDYGGPLPPKALTDPTATRNQQIARKNLPLEYVPGPPSQLRTNGILDFDLESELIRLSYDSTGPSPKPGEFSDPAPESYPGWEAAIRKLAETSREKRLLPVPLPEVLQPKNDLEHDWTPCPAPFAGVETYRVGQNGYVLGFRGSASDDLRQRLLALNPSDAKWAETITKGVEQSRAAKPGRFLARYVQTVATVFPCIYVFSTSHSQPTADRDTFVVVCTHRPLDLNHLDDTGLWTGKPFATLETLAEGATPQLGGQMDSLLELSGRIVLSDDFAPVDNLLRPVFALQD
jgi:MFS family permease